MKCPECDNEVKINTKTCSHCGYPIHLSAKDRIILQIHNNTRKQNIILLFSGIIILLLCFCIGNALILHSRATFDTEEEMQLCLQGTWQQVGDDKKIVFRGDEATMYWKYKGLEMTCDVTYFPKKGYIKYIGTRYNLKRTKSNNVRLVSSEGNYERISDSISTPYQQPGYK